MPVYNAEAYLAESLRSAQAQDLRDIEIIGVDDCSTDNSHAMLEAFSREDARIIPLRHERNQRQGAARNTGMAAAKGDYVFFLDSDDFLAAPDALSVLYRVAKEDNADEVIGRTLRWTPETDEREQHYHAAYQAEELRKTTVLRNPELAWNMPSWNKLMRLDMLRGHGVTFDTRLLRYEDYDFSCRVHVLAREISFTPYTTYIHRMRQGSTVHSDNKEDSTYHLLAAQNIIAFMSRYDHRYHNAFKIRVNRYITKGLRFSASFDLSDTEIENLMRLMRDIVAKAPAVFLPQSVAKLKGSIQGADYRATYAKLIAAVAPSPEKDLRQLNKQVQELQEKNKKLQNELKEIHSSFIWKLTSPLYKK